VVKWSDLALGCSNHLLNSPRAVANVALARGDLLSRSLIELERGSIHIADSEIFTIQVCSWSVGGLERLGIKYWSKLKHMQYLPSPSLTELETG